jgi:hypothetical protein
MGKKRGREIVVLDIRPHRGSVMLDKSLRALACQFLGPWGAAKVLRSQQIRQAARR